MDGLDNILVQSRRAFLKGTGTLATSLAAESVFPFLSRDAVAHAVPRPRQPRSSTYPFSTEHALPSNSTRKRDETLYVILHTTEAEFPTVHKIKQHFNAHYLVDRNGMVYPIVDRDHWANHAGKSMWEGKESVSDISVGIELVGYHYAPISEQQYASLKLLVKELQSKYKIPDKNVLGHYQVAYAVNRWTNGKKARGRKKDGINIDWAKIGIRHRTDDPDVMAGRVKPDPLLASILEREARVQRQDPVARVRDVYDTTSGSNVIAGSKTPWSIAGDEYDKPTTFYVFPNKIIKAGNEISEEGWRSIPPQSRIYLNTDRNTVARNLIPILTLGNETVWRKVQSAYNSKDTFYIPPGIDTIISGDKADFRYLKPGTRIVLGATGPSLVGRKQTPQKIAGNFYKTDKAIYVFKNGEVKTGNDVSDFRNLEGVRLLVKK